MYITVTAAGHIPWRGRTAGRGWQCCLGVPAGQGAPPECECVSLFPWRYSKYHSLLIFQDLYTQLPETGTTASLLFPVSFTWTASWRTLGTKLAPAAERLRQEPCWGVEGAAPLGSPAFLMTPAAGGTRSQDWLKFRCRQGLSPPLHSCRSPPCLLFSWWDDFVSHHFREELPAFPPVHPQPFPQSPPPKLCSLNRDLMSFSTPFPKGRREPRSFRTSSQTKTDPRTAPLPTSATWSGLERGGGNMQPCSDNRFFNG